MGNKKGFTLIEMLVVIAIIAVLIAIVIPTVTSSSTKAEAAVDAANLRGVLGYMNTAIMVDGLAIEDAVKNYTPPASKLNPGSELYVLYTHPGFIDVYYVDGTNYYGLDYLSDVAQNGSSSLSTVAPSIGAADVWYKVG